MRQDEINRMPEDEINCVREELLTRVRMYKRQIIDRLESGNRDWDGLRKAVNRYIGVQEVCDILGERHRQ